MKIRRLTILFLVGWIALSFDLSAKPFSAYLEAEEIGQSILLERLGTCYAIAPEHVINGGFFASVTGGHPSAPQGEADVLMTFGYDLAIMRVSGGVSEHCHEKFKKPSPIDDLITSKNTGHLITVRSDGSIGKQQVTISDTGILYLRVSIFSNQEPLMKGMSGSLLEINNQPAGMLMSVDPETGTGKVLRYDRLLETISPFFGHSITKASTSPPSIQDKKAKSNLAKAIVNWSHPSLNAQSRALNLLDENPNSVWYAKIGTFPVNLEFELSEDKSVIVKQIELVRGLMEPKKRLIRDFEIMTSNKKRGGWLPLTNGTLFANDESTRLQITPVRAKRLLLRIYSNWGDTEAVGLGLIRVQ